MLAIVAAVTLLKPESNSPLSGINSVTPPSIAQGPGGPGGPNNGGQTNNNGNGGRGGGPGGHNGRHGENGPNRGGRHNGANVPTGTATASAGASPTVAPPAGTETSPTRPEGGVEGGTPTEDQYADTIDSIDSALR